MLNLQQKVSLDRYRMILLTESAFWDMEMNALAGLERTGKLLGRLGKHLLRKDSVQLQSLTREALWARLFRSKKYRIERWQQSTQQRLGIAPTPRVPLARPMVSVCMAAYNGEAYVEAQLRSILPQLRATDEIVIIDDCSQDQTVKRIETVLQGLPPDSRAPRIAVIARTTNQGVVPTFEQAVRSATGDILFLCDDDDIWAANRVAEVLDVFARQPEVNLVATGLALIDSQDQPLEDDSFLKHRRFDSNFIANLLHNQFQGSTMAFRATLLHAVLPFPARRLFLHDAWIGTRSALTGNKAVFLEHPLLLYRRHHGNYSRRLSRARQIRLRLQLLGSHILRLFS